MTRGEEFLQKRKFQEAVMEFRAAADIDRDSAAAHWGLARAFEQLEQFNEALEELRKTAALAPENLDAKIKLGNYYLLVQPPMIAETEQILEEVFAKDAGFIEGHILKASLFAARNKPEKEVLGVLNQAIELDPNRPESYISEARFFMKHDQAADAEAALQKGIAVNPNAALALVEYGRFLVFANRASESEAPFKKATEAELQKKNLELENQRIQSQIGQLDRQIQYKDQELQQNSGQIASLEQKINTIPNVKVAPPITDYKFHISNL